MRWYHRFSGRRKSLLIGEKDHRAMRDIGYKIPLVSIVDDDESVRDALKGFIQSIGFRAETFAADEDFLVQDMLDTTTCMIVDVHMPVMNGLEHQWRLDNRHWP